MKIRELFKLVAFGLVPLFAGSPQATVVPSANKATASVAVHDDSLVLRLTQLADPSYVNRIGDLGDHSQHFV